MSNIRNTLSGLLSQRAALEEMTMLARKHTSAEQGSGLLVSGDQQAIAELGSWSQIARGVETLLRSPEKAEPDRRVQHAVAQGSLYCSPFAEQMGIVGEVDLGRNFKVRPRPDDGVEGAVTLVSHFISGSEKILPESQAVIARKIDHMNELKEEGGTPGERYVQIVERQIQQKGYLGLLVKAFDRALKDFRNELGIAAPASSPVSPPLRSPGMN